MTYKEKLQKEHPEKVNESFLGGCSGCPDGYDYCLRSETLCPKMRIGSYERCAECWNREIPSTEDKKTESLRYIHDLIEDAMKKKDRYVTIFFGESGTHVSVYPLTEEENNEP